MNDHDASFDHFPEDNPSAAAALPERKSPSLLLPLIAAGLSLFGGIFITIGLFAMQSAKRLTTEGMTATGIVTELEERWSTSGSGSNRRSSKVYYPRFRFTDATGQLRDVTSNMGSNPASYSVGETVTVRYLPAEPHEAVIDSWVSLWLFPTIFIGVGALPELAAMILLVVWVRKRRTANRATIDPIAASTLPKHSPLHERLERTRV